jgi:hypothetical protein
VLIIAGWHLLRLVLTVQQWAFLTSYPELSPLYLSATGLIGFVAGVLVSWSLWCSKPWAARAARLFSLGYALYWWIDRLLLQRSPIQENWFFPVLVTLLGVTFTFWATRSRIRPLPST